jgi:hypothetical protein
MITVSYDMALRLKEAGWDKETAFCYSKYGNLFFKTNDGGCVDMDGDGFWGFSFEDILQAPTFSEIIVGTPCEITENKHVYVFTVDRYFDTESQSIVNSVGYYSPASHERLLVSSSSDITEAAAEMWIKGKKEGWIK